MLTESLFADECEPFFNSIDPKRTLEPAQVLRRVPFFLAAPSLPLIIDIDQSSFGDTATASRAMNSNMDKASQ